MPNEFVVKNGLFVSGTSDVSGNLLVRQSTDISGSLAVGLNLATGTNSAAFGNATTASANVAFAHGSSSLASAIGAHAEGWNTIASGQYSHAEGLSTVASGALSHARGRSTIALGDYSNVEGWLSTGSGEYTHAEGFQTHASGQFSHTEGNRTFAFGGYAHAEGSQTEANGQYSHAEGSGSIASGNYSHAEGGLTIASGLYSHAKGFNTIASGDGSTSEGSATVASGLVAHAEGQYTSASGEYSHAEGSQTIASGPFSHAEGGSTIARQTGSHSEGVDTIASGLYSHAEGLATSASGHYQHAQGRFNATSSNALWILGNGTSETDRKNLITAFTNSLEISASVSIFGHISGSIETASFVRPLTQSLTIGRNIATGTHSIAIGQNSIASGNYSFAGGEASWASGDDSFAFGQFATASNEYAAAFGVRAVASGINSFANGFRVIAAGGSSHAEGLSTFVNGNAAHVEGAYASASGDYSHAEGEWTRAVGASSHAEGSGSIASGNYSHAEGLFTSASGIYSHAEGGHTVALAEDAHAEGTGSTAQGVASHAEGFGTLASGVGSHSEGQWGIASGNYSHVEGWLTRASSPYSHAEGGHTLASAEDAHSEGSGSVASGIGAHAEGLFTSASGNYSHAEGEQTRAAGVGSHAEGVQTIAEDTYSHAEGSQTRAFGAFSHAEGASTVASASFSHAEGNATIARGASSHAEGETTLASGQASHAEGLFTSASGIYSHAEGEDTQALFRGSHAEGLGTIASASYQHVEGQYNTRSSTALWILGDGNSTTDRKNLITAFRNNLTVSGTLNVTGSLVATSILGTTHAEVHVSVSGSDSLGNGSTTAPYRTLLNAIASGSTSYGAGNYVVFVHPGTYAATTIPNNTPLSLMGVQESRGSDVTILSLSMPSIFANTRDLALQNLKVDNLDITSGQVVLDGCNIGTVTDSANSGFGNFSGSYYHCNITTYQTNSDYRSKYFRGCNINSISINANTNVFTDCLIYSYQAPTFNVQEHILRNSTIISDTQVSMMGDVALANVSILDTTGSRQSINATNVRYSDSIFDVDNSLISAITPSYYGKIQAQQITGSLFANFANVIYVSSGSGNDFNDGTYLRPKKTILNAIDSATTGTKIKIGPGIYREGAFINKVGLILEGDYWTTSVNSAFGTLPQVYISGTLNIANSGYTEINNIKFNGATGTINSAQVVTNNCISLGTFQLFSAGAATHNNLRVVGLFSQWTNGQTSSFNNCRFTTVQPSATTGTSNLLFNNCTFDSFPEFLSTGSIVYNNCLFTSTNNTGSYLTATNVRHTFSNSTLNNLNGTQARIAGPGPVTIDDLNFDATSSTYTNPTSILSGFDRVFAGSFTGSLAGTASWATNVVNPGATVTVSGSSPTGSATGSLWWSTEDGNLYVQANSPTGSTWVPAVSSVAGSTFGATYTDIEAVAATTWSINHGLNTTTPIVQVYTGSRVMIPDSIRAVNANNLEITFAAATAGTAIVSTGVGGPTSASFAATANLAVTASYLDGSIPTLVQAQNTSGQSIGNNVTPSTTITGWTNLFTQNAAEWNATTGVFTATKAGVYLVSANLTYADKAAALVNQIVNISIFKNTTAQCISTMAANTTSSTLKGTGTATAIVSLAVSDTITIRTYHNLGSSSTLTTSATNNVTIQEIASRISD